MIYLNKKETQILSVINKFGCIRIPQLANFLDFNDYEKIIYMLVRKNLIKQDNDIIYASSGSIDHKMLKAIEVIVFFKDKIEWFSRSDYPYVLSFYMNNNLFDIAVLDNDYEPIDVVSINKSDSNKVIVIVDDISLRDKLDIKKDVRFCTVEPVEFYK